MTVHRGLVCALIRSSIYQISRSNRCAGGFIKAEVRTPAHNSLCNLINTTPNRASGQATVTIMNKLSRSIERRKDKSMENTKQKVKLFEEKQVRHEWN